MNTARKKHAPYADVWATVAYPCDDNDCRQDWHITSYWFYSNGKYSYCDQDGNHEPCSRRDLPSADEIERSWLDYSKWVVEHGEDPLSEFMVSPERKVKRRWQFKFSKSLIGTVLVAARHRGRIVPRQELPDYVVQYLNLDKTRRKDQDFSTFEEAEECGIKWNRWQTYALDTAEPDRGYVRKLKALARQHIKREEKRNVEAHH